MERACTEYRISIYTRKRGVERPEWTCRTIRKCCTGCITTVSCRSWELGSDERHTA